MFEGLRGVFFDLGSTLVYRTVSEEEAFFRIGQEVGLDFTDDRALRRGLRAGRHYYRFRYPRCRTPEDEEALLLGLLRVRLEPVDPEAAANGIASRILREARDYTRWWALYDDVRPCLEAAREAGMRLGIISNWLPSLPEFCRAMGLDPYFDVLVASRSEGLEKPSPDLFLRAAQRLGLSPEECLHVGDSVAADIQGALGAGLHAALLDRNEAHTRAETPILRRLTDLLPAFQQATR